MALAREVGILLEQGKLDKVEEIASVLIEENRKLKAGLRSDYQDLEQSDFNFLQNPTPSVVETRDLSREDVLMEEVEEVIDPLDSLEIFEMIRGIYDPEHPLTLEELEVLSPELVSVRPRRVVVHFKPTIPTCSLSQLIGLTLVTKLRRSVPRGWKVDVLVSPGSHNQERQINKQLNDKERCIAALEQPHIASIVEKCILPSLDLEEPLRIAFEKNL